jgi:hypothetical protein
MAEDGDCYGGSRVIEGPACYTGKSYWGAAKKPCDIDPYGAPPMYRSKEDCQVGCTENSY